jgi:hypothetical protein
MRKVASECRPQIVKAKRFTRSPSLLYVLPSFRSFGERPLCPLLGNVHAKLRLIQVQISATNDQRSEQDRTGAIRFI